MIIQNLVANSSNAGSLLAAYRNKDGYADISGADWDTSLAVIRGVQLDRIQIVGQEIKPNFVECRFDNGRFVRVSTDGHFWSARNQWINCLFAHANLRQVVSPQNRFEHCIFENTTIERYQACETEFNSCKFVSSELRSLNAVSNPQRKTQDFESSLLFSDCEFDAVRFVNCDFGRVAFRNCTFRNPTIENCAFKGVIADESWWGEAESIDLFVVFLEQVISVLSNRLSKNSMALWTLRRFRDDYVAGRTESKDYSKDLYSGDVSDDELDIVEEALDDVAPRFKF